MKKKYEVPELEITNFNVKETLMTIGDIEPYAATMDPGQIASGSDSPWD